jgi:hypothetical protein
MMMRSLVIGFETTTRTRRRFYRASSSSSSAVRSLGDFSWSFCRRHEMILRLEIKQISSVSSSELRFFARDTR